MKNLKSILKKLTLILLASFLLVGSLNLLAMDPDSDPKGEAVPSFHEAGAQAKESRVDFEGAEDSEDSDSDSDTESEYSDDEQEKRKIKFVLQDGTKIPLSENFNHNISGYISALVMFSGSEVEIKIDESSPENIRQVCNETIIRKLIGYLELVSENTSLFMLRSDLEDESSEDFKALSILADFFGVDYLCEAVASIIADKFIMLANFKKSPSLFHNSSDWQYKIMRRYRSCLSGLFDYRKIHEGRYESKVKRIQQSYGGRFIYVLLENGELKILKRDNDTGQYVDIKTYKNVYNYKLSEDGKPVCVKYNYNQDTLSPYSLKILRWNGSIFIEKTYVNVFGDDISADGKTVCVQYNYNRETWTYSLKILRWNEEKNIFVAVGLYENVTYYNISSDGKTVCVKYNYNRDTLTSSLKILRWNGTRFDEPGTYANIRYYNISSDGKTVFVKFLDRSLKIFRLNEEVNQFVEVVMYNNVEHCEFSADCKMVFVKYNYNRLQGNFSLKILRLNGTRFDELVSYEDVTKLLHKTSADSKMIYVKFLDRSLKILRLDVRSFVESGTYECVDDYNISADGKTVCVKFVGILLKILRLNEEGNQFVEVVTYNNVEYCEFSADGKMVYVKYLPYPLNSALKILRWDGNQFVESRLYENVSMLEVSALADGKAVCVAFNRHNRWIDTHSLIILRFDGSIFVEVGPYEHVYRHDVCQNGKTVFIKFNKNTGHRTYSLKILIWEGSRFVEHPETYDNVHHYDISADSRQICISFVDGSFKILRKYPEVKNLDQAMFVSLAQKEQARGDVLDLAKSDNPEQNTTGLLQILGSFDEDVRNYLIEKYKINVESLNLKQAMFLSLAVKKYNSETQTGLDLTLSDSEEQNTTDLLETFRSMPQETQFGLMRDWKVKISSVQRSKILFRYFLRNKVKPHNILVGAGVAAIAVARVVAARKR